MGDRLKELAKRVNEGTSTGGGSSKPSGGKKSNDAVAQEVINGDWGNMPERQNRLEAAGYNYADVQALVNKKMGVGGGSSKPASTGSTIKVGSTVSVSNPVDENGTRLSVSGNYTVMELKGSRAVIGRGGQVTAAINVKNLRIVSGGGSAPASKPAAKPAGLKVGDKVVVTKAVDEKGVKLAVSGTYSVMEISGNRVVIGRGGVVTAALNKANVRKA